MSEWDHRQLCSDGACVGVIGADGVCKVCGRAAPNWGDERKRGMVEASSDDADDEDEDDDEDETSAESESEDDEDEDDEDEDDEDEDEDDDEDDEDEDDDSDDDSESGVITAKDGGEWGKRELCPDGGCVGVIGDKGVCNVCGKSAA